MKEQEERAQNGEVTPTAEVSPVKAVDEGEPPETCEEPDSTAREDPHPDPTDIPGEGKESQAAGETAQGALGQVKAKVEVCKDESIGKVTRFLSLLSFIYTWSGLE